ncbi:winged helix-turn-helix transcriptional regulator [Bacillaceae bacterium SIJ1]|uniref:ArsR/SmtB family transcription factor n=1 Tax=Litoribacterium kuwaitense TaxID=1398745 RepID=UPI0013EA7DB4|nr:metalloregulator ArsR/SmtB family transcription factor [Litoribacterium kuwaitense]NGP45905.1 winged helix-turn-helix transcriptional regulator [Litoribacterium kuwaitense]
MTTACVSKRRPVTDFESPFKALADEKRLKVLKLLTKHGASCVVDLMEYMDMPQSKLSYHLKILLRAGFIEKESRGTWSYYTVREDRLRALLSDEVTESFWWSET